MHTGLPPSRAATHELIDGMLGPSGGSCFLQSELFMFFLHHEPSFHPFCKPVSIINGTRCAATSVS